MSDEVTPPSSEPSTQVDVDSPRLPWWWRFSPVYRLPARFRRYSGRLIIGGIALIAAALVSVVTIDLGPAVRSKAEQAVSIQLDRPVHIGRLGAYLLPGRFLIEDFVIEGLLPGDEPFFTTERIVISMSWVALLRGEILVDDVEVSPWRMVAESFPDGRQSFPRFVAPGDTNDERRFVTTVRRLLAHDGEFVYRDHVAPWYVTARNIDMTINKGDGEGYSGDVAFRGGTVEIASFEPMAVAMEATFDLEGGDVTLTQADLTVDGFRAALTGEVAISNWPEQTYYVLESDIDFPTMKEVFFAGDPFTVDGRGRFTGVWHIFDGGRELTGAFESDDWMLNGLAFQDMAGSLVWTRDRFDVVDYKSDFYDGDVQLSYSMAPLGTDEPGMATLDATVTDADIQMLFDAMAWVGVRPEGRGSSHNFLQWPLGHFSSHTGEGHLEVVPPDGTAPLMTRGRRLAGAPATRPYAAVPFNPEIEAWRFPVGVDLTYTISPELIEIAQSHLATPATFVQFYGHTAFGDQSQIPFKVSSIDWQESDRLLSAFMTAFGRPTREFAVAGRGEFDGVMLGEFTNPRIEAAFTGEAIRAWNVPWGQGRGRIVVENAYLDVFDGVFDQATSAVAVDGRFAVGFPRADGGEEINARFVLTSLPSQRLRNVFSVDGYQIDGPVTGEIRLYGHYKRLFGFGSLKMTELVAWGEPFDVATAGLRFEGEGVRIDGLALEKGAGQITGAIFVRWDGTYSLNIDGRDIAVDSIQALTNIEAALGGVASFMATGAGVLANPRYELRGAITDLSVNEVVVGQLSGRVNIRDGVMGLEIEAGSPSLAISGAGRVELTPSSDVDLLFRFTNTTLDPYVRAYAPSMPEETSMVVSGTLQVTGPLRDVDSLLVQATVEQLEFGFFDYMVRNDAVVEVVLDQNVLQIQQMDLVGDGTALTFVGQVGLVDEQISLHAEGDANLGVLQGFFSDLRSSGTARLGVDIGGTLRQPVFLGDVSVEGGRLRHLSLPRGVEDLEGRIVFDPDGMRFDDLVGVLAGGPVQFGGRLGIRGYALSELNIIATATEMNLRFPEGVRSVVDATLMLDGSIDDATLSGTVNVRDAVWLDLFESSTGLLDFSADDAVSLQRSVEAALPLRYDVRIVAPSSLRISNSTARIVSSAELTLTGTFDQPTLLGNAEIERGEIFFEGNRYRVTRGSIVFSDPISIVPFFDIEAETDIRVPGQTYRVMIDVSGTIDRLDPELSSDPPLQETEILSLLLGDVRDPQAAEIRALRAQEVSRQELLQAGAARLLTSPILSNVGRVVEESLRVDSFEITPALDPATQSTQLLPTARLLIGKRISDRAHVTFSRAVSGSNRDLIVVLEYDQTDRLSWVVSQNEDRTYALDFRVRHSF
jgi:hypothetical protein